MDDAASLADELQRSFPTTSGRLRFTEMLEAHYELETGPARCRHLSICGIVALFLYDCFLISDWRLIPDIFQTALVVRLGVVTPIALLIVAILLSRPSARIREASQATISVIVAASVLYLTSTSQSPLVIFHHYGIILVVLFANVVQRLHFPYAVAASTAIVTMYTIAVGHMPSLPSEAALSSVMILSGGAVFTLVANYSLERQFRIGYLLRLKDRLRRDELEGLSRQDPLTGLGNRRELDRHLERLWPESGPARTISMMMVDVDHFKSYNDGFGHLAGDKCLQRIAALIAGELRGPNDRAFRYGGEEFLILCEGMDMARAVSIAERVRLAVDMAAIPHKYSPVAPNVTVSIGVAATPSRRALSCQELIRNADAALYRAKQSGRNRIWPPAHCSAEIAEFPSRKRLLPSVGS